MAKKSIEDKIDALTKLVEKGFAAVAGDFAHVEERLDTLATKIRSSPCTRRSIQSKPSCATCDT